MTETDRIDRMRTNDLKINKNYLASNKGMKSTRGISLDNDHKAIDGLTKLITQTNKNDENSNQALKLIFRNEENSNVKSLSPEKGFHIDYILPPLPPIKMIELDNTIKDIHVLKRTGVDDFLRRMAQFYEIIIFTASLSKYADPLIDILDKNRVCSIRLFREHCTLFNGLYVKELKRLNRNMRNVILLDNNPASYYLDIENGLPIKSFYDDKSDIELHKIGDVLENLSQVHDVREYIKEIISLNQVDYERANLIFEEFKQNKIKYSKHMYQHTNTSYNENNISVIKSVDMDENNPSEYQITANNNNNNFSNTNYTNTDKNSTINLNGKNNNYSNNNDKIGNSIKNESIKDAGATHTRNKSSLEAEKKLLSALNNAVNTTQRNHNNNNNLNQRNYTNSSLGISNNTIGNQVDTRDINGNNFNNDLNNDDNKNVDQSLSNKNDENNNDKKININNNQNEKDNLSENSPFSATPANNQTTKINNSNINIKNNFGKTKERMFEKIAEKFNKQQIQLKILHVEKIAMQRSNQKGGTYSIINNSKNLKKMKPSRNPNISSNLMASSNSRGKLNSKRIGADSSKENSLVRNSFLNQSNTTKNSQKSEFFKLRNLNNLNNLMRSNNSSSKKNSFLIYSERGYSTNNSSNTNFAIGKDKRDNSVKSHRYGFASKNKTSSGYIFKADKKNSEKSLDTNLIMDLNVKENIDNKMTQANVKMIDNNNNNNFLNNNEDPNESLNVNANSAYNFNSIKGNVIKRPASVSNSGNGVFRSSGNFFSLRQQNSLKSSNTNYNTNFTNSSINNNLDSNFNMNNTNSNRTSNLNENSIRNNLANSNYNSKSTRSLIENRIKNNIKNAAVNAAAGVSLSEMEFGNAISSNNNNNKINAIRINKEIKNNKNKNVKFNNFINQEKNGINEDLMNAINKDNADDEYFYLTNKQNLEKINTANQTTLTNKSNKNNVNNEEEAALSAQNMPVPLEEKFANFKIDSNESKENNNSSSLNNKFSNNFHNNNTKNLYSNTNSNNISNNKTNQGNLTTKNSNNNLLGNDYTTSNGHQKGVFSQGSYNANTNNNASNTIKYNNNNTLNHSSTKIRSKKADSTPRHSYNAFELKKAVLQDPVFNNKINFFSKNYVANAPVTVRNVSASQKVSKKELIFNNQMNFNNYYNNNKKNNGNRNPDSNNKGDINSQLDMKINTDNGSLNNNEKRESNNYTNSTANAITAKNLTKNKSQNTIGKLDEFMKSANSNASARNLQNAKMFVLDINNKSNYNNSASNSKEKYFAILNKKNPKESSNTFSTSSYSTSSSANRKPFNTITNNLKSHTTMDMKIIRIQSVGKGKMHSQTKESLWTNGVNNRVTSAKN